MVPDRQKVLTDKWTEARTCDAKNYIPPTSSADNKGNNSSVKGLILTKLIGYRESMVLIICTKNELNLTNRYWDMVPDRQKVWTDALTTPKLYPSDFVGDNKKYELIQVHIIGILYRYISLTASNCSYTFTVIYLFQ